MSWFDIASRDFQNTVIIVNHTHDMNRVMIKSVFSVTDRVPYKPGTAKEDGLMLEISDLESRGIVLSIFVAKTKVPISCTVTAHLIDLRLWFHICKKQVFS